MQTSWLFRCYVDSSGVDVIDQWYREQNDAVQAKFDSRIKHHRQLERDKWVRPGFDNYKDGVSYLRFETGNIQYRIFGCPTGIREYAWLVGSYKKGTKFTPKNAESLAVSRKNEVNKDRKRSRDCYQSSADGKAL